MIHFQMQEVHFEVKEYTEVSTHYGTTSIYIYTHTHICFNFSQNTIFLVYIMFIIYNIRATSFGFMPSSGPLCFGVQLNLLKRCIHTITIDIQFSSYNNFNYTQKHYKGPDDGIKPKLVVRML